MDTRIGIGTKRKPINQEYKLNMLKSNNLTISIPSNVRCNKDCPYCISKMTGSVQQNFELMERNLNKVRSISKSSEVISILITGKCEPLMKQNLEYVWFFSNKFSNACVELQTNGVYLKQMAMNDIYAKLNQVVKSLYNNNLNTLAFSVDNIKDFQDLANFVFPCVKANNINVRVTLNVTSNLYKDDSLIYNFMDYINFCKEHDVDQFTLRKIVAPEYSKDEKVAHWILENAGYIYYKPLINQALNTIEQRGKLQWKTNFGTMIYNIDGVDFTHSEYCIQESSDAEEIRSLVFLEDGHLYPNWYGTGKLL